MDTSDSFCCDENIIHEDRLAAVRTALPAETELYDLAELFKVFGDSTRIRILFVLFGSEVCVCDLTGQFAVSGPTISHHLKVLREAGLISGDRRGTWVYYRVDPDALQQLGVLLQATPTVV